MAPANLRITKNPGGWAEIELHRPEVMNALNLALVNELSAALTELAADATVKGLIIFGAGDKAFVAGADIAELRERDVEAALQGINAKLFQQVEDFPWPVIAAIRGFALGGGCELALACDLRIAADDAQFGQPEVKLGIIPGAGAPHRLTRTVGTGKARELIFVGAMIDAAEALRIGLVNRVVPVGDLMESARDTMAAIRKNGALAVRLAKVACNAASNSVDRRHQMIEVLSQGILFASDDKLQRMTRFLDRKKSS